MCVLPRSDCCIGDHLVWSFPVRSIEYSLPEFGCLLLEEAENVRFALRKRNLFVQMLLLEYKRGLYSVYNVRSLVLYLCGI